MATGLTNTTNNGADDVKNSLQTYFDKKLLEQTLKNIVLDQFAYKAPLPAKIGSKDVKFFRYPESDTTDIDALTEGTAPAAADYKRLELESVSCTLTQYGQVVGITDLLSAVELFNHMEQATIQNGQDAALKVDEILRNKLGSDVTGKQKRFAGAAAGGAYGDVGGTDDAMTALDILDASTNLRVNNARTSNGYFTAVMAPEVARDLMNDDDWLEASKYGDVDQLYRGEAGRYMGVRVVTTTNPFRSNAQYTYNAAGTKFSTFVVGDQAYGGVNLSTMSAYSPKMIISQGADKSDPLAQLTTVGFKFYYGCEVLQASHLVEIYSVTNYS
jgi:N4-gp56 family major capsid protein|tara:strand:- start:52 stop:1038 length:987 start_codon:yes stop_codon:yes gene_type:complete